MPTTTNSARPMASNMNSVRMPFTSALRQSCHSQIHPRLHPEHGNIEQYIAQRSASDSGHKADHVSAEPVEILGGSQAYAGYSESDSTKNLYAYDKSVFLHFQLFSMILTRCFPPSRHARHNGTHRQGSRRRSRDAAPCTHSGHEESASDAHAEYRTPVYSPPESFR